VTREISLLEEVVLQRRLVNGHCRGKETKTKDNGQTDAGLKIYLQSPDHRNWNKSEEQICCNVDGGVEHSDVFEDVGIITLCGSRF
jgi:hypothetical protein